jgi:muramoyltetrapeptide carboxypeptidase
MPTQTLIMNRKKFLASVASTSIPLAGLAKWNERLETLKHSDEDKTTTIPPPLKAGSVIGITCPAGFIKQEEIQSAVNKLKEWGFQVKVGDTVGKKDFTFGGTDEERLKDFQQMIDDSSINAIMCARGGYGSIRIIDGLDFKKLNKKPKWIIGFSDITVIHSDLNRNHRIASIHSKMCNSFPDDWSKAEPSQIDSIESIRKCLTGQKMNLVFPVNPNNRTGSAVAELVGGNLKTLESLAGSRSDISTRDKILFVEDTEEYLYSIDRMFWNLKRTGKLSKLKGLIVGGFRIKKDDEGEEFGKTLYQIVMEKVNEYNYPVCFEFPVGHQKYNVALKCGATHTLGVYLNECRLSEQ